MRQLLQRIVLTTAVLLLVAIGLATWFVIHHRQQLLLAADEWIELRILPGDIPPPKPTGPDAKAYEVLCEQLGQWRTELAARHRKAASVRNKAAIEDEARVVLEHMLPSLMRCWIGTRWDFNGTASKPGQGKIACGYFVSTVLRDAGLDVNRFRLAQQPASLIIETFLDKDRTTTAYRQKYETFLANMKEQPTGIYLCGLDTHVAFLVNHGDDFRFIHSSGSEPFEVVNESPEEAGVLQRSKARMLGNLTADREFIRTWLAGKPIKVAGR